MDPSLTRAFAACNTVEAAEKAACTAAFNARMAACDRIVCTSFTNCGRFNFVCHGARAVCVASAAVQRAGCKVAAMAIFGACFSFATAKNIACKANALLLRRLGPERPLGPIQHVFVLMLENRSFDHMLGMSGIPGINGLNGTETNTHPAGGAPVRVSSDARDITDPDPPHEFPHVFQQMTGQRMPSAPAAMNAIYDDDTKITRQGYAAAYAQHADGDRINVSDGQGVLKCFTKTTLPILTTLAEEFGVCDRWFSSLPGPTWPNRFFVHAATSGGLDTSPGGVPTGLSETVDLLGFDFRNDTIFEMLERQGFAWRVYSDDILPQVLAIKGMANILTANIGSILSSIVLGPLGTAMELASGGNSLGDVADLEDFFEDIKHPAYEATYTFIEPDYGQNIVGDFEGGNSQHPIDGVLGGERLIQRVYEALRRSPLWSRSCLVIMYDEHGGFHDHVRPPVMPAPDNDTTNRQSDSPKFNFKRLGPRVPMVIVSPFISKGKIVNDTDYDHSSIVSTMRELCRNPLSPFGKLNARDEKAPSFLKHLQPTARTDAPMSVPLRADITTGSFPLTNPKDDGRPISRSMRPFLHLAASMDVQYFSGNRAAVIARVNALTTAMQARAYISEIQGKLKALRAANRRIRGY